MKLKRFNKRKDNMNRILFVTNRNILTTSGELRLIKNRAEALYKEYGIATDFIAFASRDRIQSEKHEIINAGGEVEAYELSLTNPAITLPSYKKLKDSISKKLQTGKYGAVILSGTAMPSLAKGLKNKYNVKVYLDIHGALEDILEVSRKNSGLKANIFKLLYHVDKSAVRKGLKSSEGVFVVTKALEEYLKERYPIAREKNFYIIPCATSTNPIDEDEYQTDRIKYRKKYNISTDELVFIYSGGVSSWQCVAESIELYKALAEKLSIKTRMLVFSHNIKEIEALAKGDQRIQTDSYTPEELFHALRVGDFAFLLRRDNLTNNVAFPNKFLEYVQSGMHIISTPYVNEIADQINEYNLGYIYDFSNSSEGLLKYIQSVVNTQKDWNNINSVLVRNSFSVTTQSFAEGFLNGN